MLPKFLIADNSQEALDLVYVVHTENHVVSFNVIWTDFTVIKKFTGSTKNHCLKMISIP